MEDMPIAEVGKLLFDRQAERALEIVRAIWEARSGRWTEIARKMGGSESAAYKRLQRFVAQVDLQETLGRLHDPQAPFVIGDPTEIARPEAEHTEYVGYLEDGKTRGFWMLLLATPYRGRAVPCSFVTYSSKSINDLATSRNQYHFQAFADVKELLGERPLVLDREFSYLALLQALQAEQVQFVIRLKLSASHAVRFTTAEGQPIQLSVRKGTTEVYHQIRYKGDVPVNVIGSWGKGFAHPLWVMTSLSPETGLEIYRQRMKIELCFRDLKSLLGMQRIMNLHETAMQRSLALVALAFAIGYLTGELLRDLFYAGQLPTDPLTSAQPPDAPSRKWHQYSGLFVLLTNKRPIPSPQSEALATLILAIFTNIIFPVVRTPVRT